MYKRDSVYVSKIFRTLVLSVLVYSTLQMIPKACQYLKFMIFCVFQLFPAPMVIMSEDKFYSFIVTLKEEDVKDVRVGFVTPTTTKFGNFKDLLSYNLPS